MNTCYKCGQSTEGDNLQCEDCRAEIDRECPSYEEDILTECLNCGWWNDLFATRCVDCKKEL